MWLVGGVVRRYIDFLIILLIPTPLVLALFCNSISTSLFIFKMFFFVLVYVIFVQYIANVAHRTFEIVQKSRSRGRGDIIISTSTYVDYIIRVPRIPRARYRVMFHESCS